MSRRAPFTYAAWTSPGVVARVSRVAGIDLVPHVDWEIANIKVSASYDQSTETKNIIDDFNDRLSTVA